MSLLHTLDSSRKTNFFETKNENFPKSSKRLCDFGHFSICASSQPFNKTELRAFPLFGCSIASHFVNNYHIAKDFMKLVEGVCSTFGSVIVLVRFAEIIIRMH